MRKSYHVIIDDENEVVSYIRVLEKLGVDPEFSCTERQYNDNKFKHESVIELSKYELLYLRLSVKTGNIKEITSNEAVLHPGSGLHA